MRKVPDSQPSNPPIRIAALAGLARLVARLSVSRKLMLIYALDFTAVIYLCVALINEKFIAIDFARKEVQGNAYIAALRDPLVGTARAAAGDAQARQRLDLAAELVALAQQRHGQALDSEALSLALQQAMGRLAQAAGDAAAPAGTSAVTPSFAAEPTADPTAQALDAGQALVTRIANQSNLILDPDLDTYYTMSLLALRMPELLRQSHELSGLVRTAGTQALGPELRSQHLLIEGRIDAALQALSANHAEAYAAGGNALRAELSGPERALIEASQALRRQARAIVELHLAAAADRGAGALPSAQARLAAAQRQFLQALQASWQASGQAMDRLLQARIERLYRSLWVELGTALLLLLAILATVSFVARQIAQPLQQLAGVADHVRTSGDHSLRAHWDSDDEIGRLVRAFNDMLGQLDRERAKQQELAASARAAEAQRELVEHMPIALMVSSVPAHEVLHANAPAQAWLAGRRQDPWRDGLEPAARTRFFQQLADRDAVDEFEARWLLGPEPAWVVLSARRLRYQGQEAVLTAFAPINHLKLMERRLALWAKVFQASSEAILILDAERRVVTANAAFARHTGFEAGELIGELPTAVFGDTLRDADTPLWRALLQQGSWQGECSLRRRNGSEYPAWVMASVVREGRGEVTHGIVTSIDITDRKASEQRIRFLAEHDVLTELPNRAMAIERLRLALLQAERSGQRVAVLFLDLDRFKQVNDSLGHHVGDELLRSVAQRLRDTVRAVDIVSRLGGDEFVVVLAGVDAADEVTQVVHQRLIPRLRQAHEVGGVSLQVSCSVGIAIYPDDDRDPDALMRQADAAMYEAKAAGKDQARFFTAAMTERAQARLRLEGRLRRAHEAGALQLHWQPRVAAQGGQLRGVEGLLRWHDAELGAISPAEFVPIAEETGLIVPIGAWVIEQACAQIAAWRQAGLPAFGVSINLSARQLGDAGLVDTVREALHRHAVPPAQLELELTESVIMERASVHQARVHALRSLGVSIAIDDFGTGYSSLAYLSRLPCDRLKIDRAFVHDLLADATARAIVHATINLGHTLGLIVVAEGVEREEEADVLRQAGCDELQGYLYARPLAEPDLRRWMAQHLAPPPVEAPKPSAGQPVAL